MGRRDGNGGLRLTLAAAWEPLWPVVAPMLAPAVERSGEATLCEVAEAIEAGDAQLWIAHDAERVGMAMVTRLNRTARGLVCEIWQLGGANRGEWLGLLPQLEAAAKERGCVAVEIIGRRGWARLLPEYRETAVVLEKRL